MLSLPTPPKCFAASVLATLHAAFAQKREARPSGFVLSRPYGFTCVTARQLAHHPFQMALSIGFRMLSFLPSCYSSYGAWTLTPVGLAPTVHASLRWTHRLSGLVLWNSLPGEFIQHKANGDLARLLIDDKASFMQRRVIARAAVRRVLRTVEVMRVGTFV